MDIKISVLVKIYQILIQYVARKLGDNQHTQLFKISSTPTVDGKPSYIVYVQKLL